MTGVAACTVVAKSGIADARVIATSWAEHHPDIPCFALLADEVDGYFDPAKEPFTLIELSELEPAAAVQEMCARYGKDDFSCAVTPYAIAHLLDQGFEKVLFFKQESMITGDHTSVIKRLDEHPIVLTPHITAPREVPGAVEWELTILKAGVYNGGFVGVSESEQARAMLDWWQARLVEWCRMDVGVGMHREQGWLSLVPTFFPGTHILREPESSTGHWNLPERAEVAPRLLRVSGHDRRRRRISRYNALTVADAGSAGDLYRDYEKRLKAAGYRKVRKWPWAFDEPAPYVPDVPEHQVEADADAPTDNRGVDHGAWPEAAIEPADGGLAICTIFGKNHLALARVLWDSLMEHHPEMPFYALLADHPEGYFEPQDEEFPIIGLQTVGYGDQWLNADEGHKGLAPQLKPYLLSRLLDAGFDSVFFIDADMLLTAPIPDVLEQVASHDVTLSPHILEPLEGPLHVERELVIIRAGAYNGGILGVRASPGATLFLDWWKDRMHGRCIMDRFLGTHHDQRWMNLVPSLVEDVHTLRQPDINVGHWNLPERAGVDARLLHFSGYRLGLGDQITYYDTRSTKADIGELAVWWDRYDELLRDAGFEESRDWPYGFGPRPFHPAGHNDLAPAPAP